MLRLALDSATEFLSVALADGETLLAQATARRPRGAEGFLPEGIEFVLRSAGRDRNELAGVIVTTGPGSFTGVRVGMGVALGFAEGLGVPLHGLDTLRALALACPRGGGTLAVALDAKRDELYGAIFRKSPRLLEEVEPARAQSPAAFAARFVERRPVTALCGTANHLYTPADFPGADRVAMPWLAPALLGPAAAPHLRTLDAAALSVDYLRGADAKLPAAP